MGVGDVMLQVQMGAALCAALLLLLRAWKIVNAVWVRPMKLQAFLKHQGVHGNPYNFFSGDITQINQARLLAHSKPIPLTHQIVPRVVPSLHQTVKIYGKTSVNWLGPVPRVNLMDPDLARDVLSNKFGHFAKLDSNPLTKMLALGVASYEGEKWAKHRRILNPAFHQEKIKRMVPAFYASSTELISRWEKLIVPNGLGEIDVWPELQSLTADAISRTAFGSSYKEGMRIFELQTEQAELVIKASQNIYIPGYRFLPTKDNLRRKEIKREVETLLKGMIEKRLKAMKVDGTSTDDLLGLLLESNNKEFQETGNSKSIKMTMEEVIEECKLFYFAGQETTSVLLTWTMVVLSMHQDWQARAREEVLQLFGKNKPDYDSLSHLKTVTMILNEVLRLYPPGIFLVRRTYKEMELGNITLPSGVQICLPIILIHHDREIWGEDAEEFNPERFSGGISKASKHPNAFFPFGGGPRICIGQNFALVEAKVALSMILQHFSFELSPSYAHAPHTIITLQPQHGAQIILHKL